VGAVIFMGLMTMLPTLLLLMTSFTRILIVLHFLRQALGTQSAPPAHMLAALALLLTGFVMAPTLDAVNTNAVKPWMDGQIDEGHKLTAGVGPYRDFIQRQTPEADLVKFVEMSDTPTPETAEEVSLPVLMSAFATSELRAAFRMGFAIFLPFIIIDLVVSAVLTSMGMFMLPPTMIALPCKLLLFVLVDGWTLTVQGLVASFS
jgi:flagellar biosynthetic protein FliP